MSVWNRRCVALRVGLVAGAVLALCGTVQAQVSQLVISEAFGGGAQSAETPNADYVEIYNRGPNAVSLNGLSVQVASPTSTTWNVIPLGNVVLPANQHYLVQCQPNQALGIDFDADVTSASAFGVMTSANGKCALVNGTTALSGSGCPIAGNVIDLFGFGTASAWENCTGAKGPAGSIAAGNVLSAHRKFNGCQDTNNNANDFVQAAPSPTKSGVTQTVNRDFIVSLSPATSTQGAGQLVSFTASLRDCTAPVLAATVSADLSPFGLGTLSLFDNGLSGDGAANDGVYGGSFNVPLAQGPGNSDITVSYVKDATSGNQMVSHFVFAAPPANDACASAIDISATLNGASTYSASVNNESAGSDQDVGTCNSDSVTRFGFWYVFTPTTNGAIQFAETGDQDAVFGVFTYSNIANQCGTLTSVACLTADAAASYVATAGTTYYLLIGNQTATGATPPPTIAMDISIAFAPAPANDVCAAAVDMSSTLNGLTQFSASVDASAAGFDADVTCNSSTASTWAGVWYSFTPTTNGGLSIIENGGPDTIRNVYSGSCGSLTSLNCLDDPDTTALSISVTAGTTYYLLVANFSSAQPTSAYDFTVDFVPPPANDNCSGATAISGFPFTDTPAAQSAGPDADVACNSGTATSLLSGVWYSFTAPGDGSVVIADTSTADTVRALYTGTCGSLTEVGCADAETAIFPVTNGTTYYAVVGQFSATASPTVPYALSFEFITPPANDACSGAIAVDLNSAYTATVDGRGAVADDDHACNGTTATSALNGVWFSFSTGLDAGVLSVNEVSAASSAWALYTGTCGSLTEVACSANDNTTFPLLANTNYRLLLSTDSATATTTVYDVAISFAANVGGCCEGTSCAAKTASACQTASGTYLGDGASCGPPAGMPQTFTGGTNVPLTITDNSTGTSEITVAPNFPIGAVEVSLDITHTYISDLVITLSNGTVTTNLHTGDLFILVNLNGVYTFSDSGSVTWDTGAAPNTDTAAVLPPGTYRASTTGNVAVDLNAAFSGQSSAGTWTLTVQDDATIDTGSLNSWSLILDGVGTSPCSAGPTPCEIADFDNANGVDPVDLFGFLDAWFAQSGGVCTSGCSADLFDPPGSPDVTDLFDYLDLWFFWQGTNPCP